MATLPVSPLRMRMQSSSRQDEDLPRPDAVGACSLDDGVDGALQVGVVHRDFQAHLLQQGAGLLHAAVDLGDPLLSAATPGRS